MEEIKYYRDDTECLNEILRQQLRTNDLLAKLVEQGIRTDRREHQKPTGRPRNEAKEGKE